MKNYLCLLNFLMKMNYKILLSLVCAGLFFASCVPTKDLIYLQTKDQSETIAPIAATAKLHTETP